MMKYLAIFLGSPSGPSATKWNALSPEEKKTKEMAGMNAWMGWAEKHNKAIVELGTPLGKTKQINNSGISDTKNLMTAYTIVQAETHEDAAKMFVNHPHFAIFPGDSVEVMECLPLPKM